MYTDGKSFYPNQSFDPRTIVDHIYPKTAQPFEDYRSNPDNAHLDARLFTLLFRRRELKMVSDGKKSFRN